MGGTVSLTQIRDLNMDLIECRIFIKFIGKGKI